MNSEEPVHVEIEKRRIIICYVILPTIRTTVGDKHEAIESWHNNELTGTLLRELCNISS